MGGGGEFTRLLGSEWKGRRPSRHTTRVGGRVVPPAPQSIRVPGVLAHTNARHLLARPSARIARIAHAAEAEATAATDPLARRVDGVPGAEVRAGYPLMARFTRNPDPSAQLRPGCP